MFKLTEQQQEILSAAHLRAALSPRVIARELKLQERTVRYHLHKLLALGIIREAPFLNVYPLGLRYYNVYFSHEGLRSKDLQRAVDLMRASDRVSWLAEMGGEFHMALSLLVRDADECADHLANFAAKFPGLFLQKQIAVHRSLRVFPAKYLSSRKAAPVALGYGDFKEQDGEALCQIDDLDHDVLKLMSRKQLTSVRAIARELGRPHTTVALHMRKLTESKIVGGYWFPIDSKRLGYQTLKLLIFCRGVSAQQAAELRRYAAEHRNIVYCIECLGSWDFELGLDVRTDGGVADIVAGIHDTFSQFIQLIKVVPMFRVLKWSLYPFDAARSRR